MSAIAPAVELAPIDVRLKLAVSTLVVSWALAALFIALGWREAKADAAATAAPAVVQSSSASHALANERAFSVGSLPAR